MSKCDSCIHREVCEWYPAYYDCGNSYILDVHHFNIDMLQAMSIIKEYCNVTNNCNECPMNNNCYSDRLTAVYPLDWYIPEVT